MSLGTLSPTALQGAEASRLVLETCPHLLYPVSSSLLKTEKFNEVKIDRRKIDRRKPCFLIPGTLAHILGRQWGSEEVPGGTSLLQMAQSLNFCEFQS